MTELSKRVSVENIPSLVKGGGFYDDGTVYNFDILPGGLLGDLGEISTSLASVPPPPPPSVSVSDEHTASNVRTAAPDPITAVVAETVQKVTTEELSVDAVAAISIGLTENTIAQAPAAPAAVSVVDEANA